MRIKAELLGGFANENPGELSGRILEEIHGTTPD